MRGRRARGTNQAALKPLFLRIPPIAVVLGELGFRGAAWFFEQQYFEVLDAEPGRVGFSRYRSLNQLSINLYNALDETFGVRRIQP